jgi:hypothetical protein
VKAWSDASRAENKTQPQLDWQKQMELFSQHERSKSSVLRNNLPPNLLNPSLHSPNNMTNMQVRRGTQARRGTGGLAARKAIPARSAWKDLVATPASMYAAPF